MTLPSPGSTIHLIGIGGTGMSAIARVLLGQGYTVTGSDRNPGALVPGLIDAGARVHIGHDAAHVVGADAVIVTSAAAADHVEVAAARDAGIPVYKRADILGDLTRGKRVIAIAGTAGKTTTTAMIAHILITIGHDPSYIIGGTLPISGVNGHAGTGDLFVIEADEYDNMFLGLTPYIAVITNIVYDHPDFFPTEADMVASFQAFVARIVPGGVLITCGDDPGARAIGGSFWGRGADKMLYYGTKADFPVIVVNHPQRNVLIMYAPYAPWWTMFMTVKFALAVPGFHNLLNAAAAITAVLSALGHGRDLDGITDALASFTGADRRFQVMGERGGVIVVDDYAHHPLKIRAALQAARSRYPDHAIWAVWQPHTYSRTQALWDDIARCFIDADHVLVTPIYAAREAAIPGIDGESITHMIAANHADARYIETFEATTSLLRREAASPAVILIMSAGDAPQIGRMFLDAANGTA